MDTLISVIIPVYKVEAYLARCVESIRNQTYTNLEIILVDDGSPDRCPQMCDEFAIKDERIKVIHKKNGGLSSARNVGMDCMHGRYITFVDSDDFLDANAIKEWKRTCDEYNADLVVGNLRHYYTQKDILTVWNGKREVHTSESIMRKMMVENQQLCAACGKLYDISLFEEIRYPEDIKFAEDMAVIHKIFDKAKVIVYDDNSYYYYNQKGESLVRSKFNFEKLKRIDAAEDWLNFVDKKYPGIHDETFAAYMKIMINECTYLLEDKQLLEQLKAYMVEIARNYKEIKRNQYINIRDKFKAFFLKNHLVRLYKLVRRIYLH